MVAVNTFQEEQHKQLYTSGDWLPGSVRNGEGGSDSRKDIQRRGHSDSEWRGSVKTSSRLEAHGKGLDKEWSWEKHGGMSQGFQLGWRGDSGVLYPKKVFIREKHIHWEIGAQFRTH